VPFQIVIGDNDGDGNAFIRRSVADVQSFPSKLLGIYGEYTAWTATAEGRDERRSNAAPRFGFGTCRAAGVLRPGLSVSGTLTSAKLEIDMGSFEATVCRLVISVSINGVPQPGFLAFSDGPLTTRVRKIPFTPAQVAAANLSRPPGHARGTSTDKVAFDYFKRSGEVIP
jgi:hypothetical protein